MSVIQGLDTIPKEIANEFGAEITRLLPDWSINGEYNFQAERVRIHDVSGRLS